ncbi:hypothetical protein I79_003450 [Cricetulus griseus]|uniref:Uncharacterized protein n=1 Tax=Cricetulus griseus TaxID=10029 RepID=G3H003_CRIGR|nr:hypothetical protein I79_003450 [Cricetulus griseus]
MGVWVNCLTGEDRALNADSKWALVVHACNLSKRFSSPTSVSLGYSDTLQPPPLKRHLLFSNN